MGSRMGRSLVIVESPAKARTINKYLGRSYLVKSSVGHIRDLPASGGGKRAVPAKPLPKGLSSAEKRKLKETRSREALIRRMGVDPENGWAATYQILPEKEKVLGELQEHAKQADAIYLATDLDREGEAIAWHLREAIGGKASRFKRVIFSEITKKAITDAFSRPASVNMDRVRAQQARRFLDRVVGYMLSPLLWSKVARGLSAGRVQSVAVRLVVEREKEIHAFTPEEYWEARADLKKGRKRLLAKVTRHKGKGFRPRSQKEAEAAKAQLDQASYTVSKRDDRPTKKRPSPPFITSTLQQAASIRLGFGVRKTMTLAQRLYEAGHITYMRTDSSNLSAEALGACREYVADAFGDNYLPEKPQVYQSRSTAQEAHEAIRPSDVRQTPGGLTGFDRDGVRLYELIWRRFVACQMKPAEYDATVITITAGQFELRANGRVMRFDGWTRVLPLSGKGETEDIVLPDLKLGDVLDLVKIDLSQHFTKPPARYGEASLVRELEKRGIGRPSTYAAIISTIQSRGYVRLEGRRFYAEKMGDIVTERLVGHFDEVLDYGFTAALEEELDAIAAGDLDWKQALDRFYKRFSKDLRRASREMPQAEPTLTDIPCEVCGRPMVVRTARTGVFLGCSGYSLPPKERCKNTVNLVHGDEVEAVDDEEGAAKALLARRRCPKCSTAMDSYLIDETTKIHICGNNPDCDGFELEKGKFRIKGYDGPVIQCDKCGADMELKTGRFGKFFACTNYPTCKNTRKLLRNGEPAPPKADPVPMPELKCEKSDGHFVLRDGAAGVFLASSEFPRSRETKSPLVEDLARHRDELDPKYHYLADAPQDDGKGNKTAIRFKRKEKEHYLVTLGKDGKPSGWSAFYRDKTWKVQPKTGSKKSPRRRTAPKKTATSGARRPKASPKKAAPAKSAAGKATAPKEKKAVTKKAVSGDKTLAKPGKNGQKTTKKKAAVRK
jgi:DNA topoisomerase-1